MEYLRAIIHSDTRGPLYKKDFKVQKVFDTFVHLHVSKLINTGEVYEGEYYKALIFPGYGQYQRKKQKEQRQLRRTHPGTKEGWIALKAPEPANPEQPMDFFTLELHLVDRPLPTVLSENFLLHEIDYFWLSVERALEQVKILEYQEPREHRLYACNDDLCDFDLEELYTLQEEANELIEIASPEMPATDLPLVFRQKTLKDFTLLETKRMIWGKLVEDAPEYTSYVKDSPPAGMQILITPTALASLQQTARSHVEVEIGGALIGHIYQNADAPGYLVEITDHILLQNTLASEVELRITFESWSEQSTVLKERYPGKRIVGWYHTHLDIVRQTHFTESHVLYSTPIFFSQDDHFTHRQFFRGKWYVAMVLDTDGYLVFYQWEEHEIVPAHVFYIVEPEKEAGES